MQESAGYPSSSTRFSDEVQSQLLNLPGKDGIKVGQDSVVQFSRHTGRGGHYCFNRT